MSYAPALALSLILLVPALATAQTGERYRPEARHRFETELGVAVYRPNNPACRGGDFSGEPPGSCEDLLGDGFYFIAQHAVRVRVHDDQRIDPSGVLAIDLDLAWRIGAWDELGTFGPLVLGAQVAWIAPGFVTRGGLGVGVPVDEALERMPWAERPLLVAPYGNGEVWLARRAVPIVLQFSFEGRHEWFFGGVDVGATWLTVRNRYAGQVGAFVGVRPITLLAFGVRALVTAEQSEWGSFHLSGNQRESISITTFARLDTRPLFAELRWLVNVDEPLGVGFDDGSLWSLRALIGWETE